MGFSWFIGNFISTSVKIRSIFPGQGSFIEKTHLKCTLMPNLIFATFCFKVLSMKSDKCPVLKDSKTVRMTNAVSWNTKFLWKLNYSLWSWLLYRDCLAPSTKSCCLSWNPLIICSVGNKNVREYCIWMQIRERDWYKTSGV